MGQEESYRRRRPELLKDASICSANRKLFAKFLDKEEYKLKRINNLAKLDESAYKTLNGYLNKLRNSNTWFRNKPWKDLTRADIKRVFDGLEDGTITKSNGKPHGDKKSYYTKIFKSKPFQMAGKADLAREVMEFYNGKKDKEVRFIREDKFRRIVEVTLQPKQRLLEWLAWDIGDNINKFLEGLRKRDCRRQINKDTKEPEYHIVLNKDNLKRSRRARTEVTNYKETVEYLDMVLADHRDNDLVFDFKYRMAAKFFERAVRLSKVKCEPDGSTPTWKDLRSSMACDLMLKGWTMDEIKARLGHSPSSTVIDVYANYLALDKHKPKRKTHQFKLEELQEQLQEALRLSELNARRYERLSTNLKAEGKSLVAGKRRNRK